MFKVSSETRCVFTVLNSKVTNSSIRISSNDHSKHSSILFFPHLPVLVPVRAISDTVVLRGQSPPVVPHAAPVIALHPLMSFDRGFLLYCFKKGSG